MQRVTDSWSLSIFYQTAAGAECWHSRMHTSRHGGMREFVILYVVTSYIDKLRNKRHAKYIRYTYTNRLISILGNHIVYRAMQYNAIEMLRILSYISIQFIISEYKNFVFLFKFLHTVLIILFMWSKYIQTPNLYHIDDNVSALLCRPKD